MEYKYQVVETNENPLESTIEKHGGITKFTVQGIVNNILHFRQKQKEVEHQWRVNEATKENIKGTHPHIAQMSLEDLTAAYMYREAVGSATVAGEKLAEINEALKEDTEQLHEVLKQTGIELPKEIREELGI